MIYAVQDRASRLIKFGYSRSPRTRLTKMRTDCPGDLDILVVIEGEKADEAQLHRQFAQYHARGEWFFPAIAVLAFIDEASERAVPFAKPRSKRELRTGLLARWMVENGLTDKQLGALLAPPVSHAQICRIRNGKSIPSIRTALQLENVTGIPAGTFVLGRAA